MNGKGAPRIRSFKDQGALFAFSVKMFYPFEWEKRFGSIGCGG
jgi:hypothetical protein